MTDSPIPELHTVLNCLVSLVVSSAETGTACQHWNGNRIDDACSGGSSISGGGSGWTCRTPPTPVSSRPTACAQFGFDGVTHPGPVIEAGELTVTTFVNDLRTHVLAADVDTTLHGALESNRTNPSLTIHLHGPPNRPEFDGYPTSALRPGQSMDMAFMGTNGLSIYSGPAAPYLIHDDRDTSEADNPIGLPSGKHEMPLLLCDKVFYPDGRLRYDNTPTVQQGHCAGGLCGDVMVVNGKA